MPVYTDIFEKRPLQWGFRGDPYLWDELWMQLQKQETPKSVEEFEELLRRTYAELTADGKVAMATESLFIDRYPASGMSGGLISIKFWQDKALPLLLSRYKTYWETKNNPG